MSKSDLERSLYDWYTDLTFSNTCPRCGGQKISELEYAHDINGIGVIYRCMRCLYEYGIDTEAGESYFDKNQNPTLYWE